MEKLIVSIILIPFIVLIFIFGTTYFNHVQIQNEINEINYNTVEVVTSLGIFPENLYFSLLDQINRFSRGTVDGSDNRYSVTIKLEKIIKDDVYDTYFLTSDQVYRYQDEFGVQSIKEINTALAVAGKDQLPILNQKLSIGDRIYIFLEDRTPTIFGNLANFHTSFIQSGEFRDIRVSSEKSSVVAKDTENLVSGYEVVAAIVHHINNPDPSLAIAVQTTMADTLRYYGYNTHPALQQVGAPTRVHYGVQADEKGEISSTGGGKHFIYGPGTFMVTEFWEEDYRIIQYIQQ